MYYFVIIVVTEERKYLLVYEVVPEDTQMKTSYARNSKLFEDIFWHKFQNKDKKHNSLYFARKFALIFVLGHSWSVRSPSLDLWSTHFSLSSVHSFLEFRRAPERVWKRTWISMKNSCSSLVTGSLEQQQQKKKNNFSFLITHFVFPFPFPIPAFSNIGICLIFKMGDFAAKRSSRCHTVSFLENGSYRGQGSWIETELNGPKLAQETHTM